MASREGDWLEEARSDLDLARLALGGGHFNWACFAAQQASEKAVKAVFQSRGADAWGHVVADLLTALRQFDSVEDSLIRMAQELDRHYIPSRYPNAHAEGAPFRHYSRDDAERAIAYAEQISRFCEDLLAR